MAILPQVAGAMPLGMAAAAGQTVETGSMVQKIWHSGVPHRRTIGERTYGGTCPPQGCPAWTQPDLVRDPYTGEWYSPRNERQRYLNSRRGYRRY
jgi:hypothetical protein